MKKTNNEVDLVNLKLPYNAQYWEFSQVRKTDLAKNFIENIKFYSKVEFPYPLYKNISLIVDANDFQ